MKFTIQNTKYTISNNKSHYHYTFLKNIKYIIPNTKYIISNIKFNIPNATYMKHFRWNKFVMDVTE